MLSTLTAFRTFFAILTPLFGLRLITTTLFYLLLTTLGALFAVLAAFFSLRLVTAALFGLPFAALGTRRAVLAILVLNGPREAAFIVTLTRHGLWPLAIILTLCCTRTLLPPFTLRLVGTLGICARALALLILLTFFATLCTFAALRILGALTLLPTLGPLTTLALLRPLRTLAFTLFARPLFLSIALRVFTNDRAAVPAFSQDQRSVRQWSLLLRATGGPCPDKLGFGKLWRQNRQAGHDCCAIVNEPAHEVSFAPTR
ncbi:hypothetical protein JJJ17_10275 [Paracoccus caeni]|uniref:Uncharacterized protein n=1 Tax=Paracoccus caeni TaxID=657651 RepID=A0A934SFZ1_9RHOB|nr:hypothetical protein [Paracoccus caeni]MBK4216311.1 hypothetical protein [Paracoccus caeni]